MRIGCGLWLVGLGFFFMLLRPPLLPEDARFMGTTHAQLRASVPTIESWLAMVFTVLGGFMAGAGVLIGFFVSDAMRRRAKGAAWALGLSGALTVGLMSVITFAIHSDFRWVLLVPALA